MYVCLFIGERSRFRVIGFRSAEGEREISEETGGREIFSIRRGYRGWQLMCVWICVGCNPRGGVISLCRPGYISLFWGQCGAIYASRLRSFKFSLDLCIYISQSRIYVSSVVT